MIPAAPPAAQTVPAAAPSCAYTAGSAVVAVPGRPFSAEPSADGCFLYAPLATGRGGAVAVLENVGGAFRLARTHPLPRRAAGAALSPDGALLAVAREGGVTLLDAMALRRAGADPGATEAPLGDDAEPIEALFSRDGTLLFVSLERAASVAVVDVAKARAGAGRAAVIGRIPQGRAPVGLALSPDGSLLYVTSQVAPGLGGSAEACPPEQAGGGRHARGALTVALTALAAKTPARSVVAATPAGCNPVRVAASADGSRVWVTARGDGELLGFDTTTLNGVGGAAPVAAVRIGPSPVGLALAGDGSRAWVAASDRFGGGDGALVRVDLASRPPVVSVRLPARGFPRDLRLLPDGLTLVAALYDGSAVRIETAGAPAS